MTTEKEAGELRRERTGWLFCELVGDDLAERIYNNQLDTSDPEACFEEFFSRGTLWAGLDYEQIVNGWEANGLLGDLEELPLSKLPDPDPLLKSAVDNCNRWLNQAFLALLPSPGLELSVDERMVLMMDSAVRAKLERVFDEQHCDLIPRDSHAKMLTLFLLNKGTDEAKQLLRDLRRRYRDWYWRRLQIEDAFHREKMKTAKAAEVGERLSEVIQYPPEEREEALKAIEIALEDLGLLDPDSSHD